MPKKVLIALPPAMLEQVDFIASCEHRTRSDLIREALRRYLDNFRRSQQSHMTVSTINSEVPPQQVQREYREKPAKPPFFTNPQPGPVVLQNDSQFETKRLDPGYTGG